MEEITIYKIINKWFDMNYRTYDKLEHKDSIYLYYDDEEFAEIRIDKKYGFIYYKSELYMEFSEIIPKKFLEFEMVMSKWVEDTFGLKGFTPQPDEDGYGDLLEIPK